LARLAASQQPSQRALAMRADLGNDVAKSDANNQVEQSEAMRNLSALRPLNALRKLVCQAPCR
jgi:hypothetical protein